MKKSELKKLIKEEVSSSQERIFRYELGGIIDDLRKTTLSSYHIADEIIKFFKERYSKITPNNE